MNLVGSPPVAWYPRETGSVLQKAVWAGRPHLLGVIINERIGSIRVRPVPIFLSQMSVVEKSCLDSAPSTSQLLL